MLDPSVPPPAPDATHGAATRLPSAATPARYRRMVEWAKDVIARVAVLATPAGAGDRAWLAVLLGLDVALIAAFLAYAHAEHFAIRDSLFYGNVRFSFVEGGYPERYGYAKQVLIVAFMLVAHRARRQPVHLALALLFTVTVADDALALHETLGERLATDAGVSPRVGELAVWSLIGIVPLAAVVAGYRRSDAPGRADGQAMLAGFALLLFFAVGMDVVHGLVGRHVTGFQTVMTIAEDGGELFALTLLCVLARRIVRGARVGPAGGGRSG